MGESLWMCRNQTKSFGIPETYTGKKKGLDNVVAMMNIGQKYCCWNRGDGGGCFMDLLGEESFFPQWTVVKELVF